MPYSGEIIEGMLADLAAAGAIPDSIKMANEAAAQQIIDHPEFLAPGPFTRALIDFGIRPGERVTHPIVLRSE